MTTPSPRQRTAALWAARVTALLALAAVFMAYLSPHLILDLAARVWACV